MGLAAVAASMGTITGEVISMGILFPITANMNAYWTFSLASGVVAGLAFVMLIGVKEPKLRSDSPVVEV